MSYKPYSSSSPRRSKKTSSQALDPVGSEPRSPAGRMPHDPPAAGHDLSRPLAARSVRPPARAQPRRLSRAPPPSRVGGHELELPRRMERQRRGRDGVRGRET
jgi:hypothetical protein